MRIKTTAMSADSDDRIVAFDWASLGRLVRRRTLAAVALHFSVLDAASGQRGLRTRRVDPLDRGVQ